MNGRTIGPADSKMAGPSVVTERFVEIAGVPTRTLEVEGEGPAILLLHGFTDSADSWRPVLAELHASSRRAVAVDMPGSGHAPAVVHPVLQSLDAFAAAFVRRYAGAVGAVLAGNSLGGLVTLRAAARGDLPLLGVAGLGPAGLAYHRRLEGLSRWLMRLDPILRIFDRIPVPTWLLRRGLRALYSRRLARGRGAAELAEYYASHVAGQRDLGRIRRDLIALSSTEERFLDPDTLRGIDVPVLLIWGDADHLANIDGAPLLLETVADSRLVVLEDCGHCPQVESPVVTAQLLADLPASVTSEHPTPDAENKTDQGDR
jgi:pimeloyl-ACP methyl ester carboxylesterase